MANREVFVSTGHGVPVELSEADAVENYLRTAVKHIRQAAELLRQTPIVRRNAGITPVAQDATDAGTLDTLGNSLEARYVP
jgi:hypothetical protein